MKEFFKGIFDKFDGEFADLRYEVIKTTIISFRGKELETASRYISQGGGIRVFEKGSTGFTTFSRPEDGKKALEEAYKLAKLGTPQVESHLTGIEPVQKEFLPELDTDPRTIPMEQKVELLRKYNQILLNYDKRIVLTQARYKDVEVERYYFSTDGHIVKEVRVYTAILFAVVAKDGNNVQQDFFTVGDQRGYNIVLNREEDAERVARGAIELLDAEPVQGGIYTVILDPELAGVFIHEAFGHLSEADHISKNEKLKKIMVPGKRFGPDFLNVIDDGSIKGENGSIGIDDDGVLPHKTYLIKEGVLNARLHSRNTAYIMNEEPTGNSRALNYSYPPIVRMTNTYIDRGEYSFEELIEGIDKGLYVIGAYGGETALEMFTFSARKGYMIENGKIGKLVRNVMLSGNVFETLMNIEKIGNDLQLHGGMGGCGKGGQFPLPVSHGAPHIKIRNVVIGGK